MAVSNEPSFSGQIRRHEQAGDAIMHTPGWFSSKTAVRDRLQIGGLEGGRFLIATMAERDISIFKKHRYIPLQYKDHEGNTQKVLVNIGSLSKRLLLTETQIRRAVTEGRLEALVEKRANFLRNKENQKVLDKYEMNSDRTVRLRHDKNVGMDMRSLFKVVKEFEKLKDGADTQAVKMLGQQQFLVAKQGTQITIISWSKKSELGSGSFGKAYKVLDVSRGVFQAFKVARARNKGNEELSLAMLEKENRILQTLNSEKLGGPHPNLQAAPHIAVKIGQEGKMVSGYLAKFYPHGDLTSWLAGLEPNERKNICRDLLDGLKELIRRNVAHGDIKPENIFMNEDKRHVIADFGDAKVMNTDKKATGNDFTKSVYTEGFCNLVVREEQTNCINNGIDFLEQRNNKLREAKAKLREGDLEQSESLKMQAKALQDNADAMKAKLIQLNRYQDFYAICKSMQEVVSGPYDVAGPYEDGFIRDMLNLRPEEINAQKIEQLLDQWKKLPI